MKLKSMLGALALTTCLSAPAFAETINVLVEGGGEQLQKAIAEKFTAETGIEVSFVVVPYAGVFERLSAEIAAGSSNYDVATIDVIWMARFAEFAEPLHFLFVMNQRSERSDGIAFFQRILNHLDGAFDSETKSVFICQ